MEIGTEGLKEWPDASVRGMILVQGPEESRVILLCPAYAGGPPI